MAIESSTPWVEPYDLFVSYSRKDDADGMVSALVAQIQAEHAEFSPTFPLKLFFDCQSIVTGDYWRETLRKGLRQSKVLLAVLSPHYFASEYCRWEWEEFLRIEQSRTIPGAALMPLFIVAPADLEGQVTPATREWWDSLAKIHGVEIHPFWPRGREVLRDNEVRERVRGLAQRAAERADLGRRLSAVPRSELERNPNFVGRVSELRQLREALTNFEIVGVCAVHGIGGIGKTSLAVEYAYCFRPEYLGGLFKLDLSTTHSVADLQSQLVTLAETKLHAAIDHGAPLERQFAAARSAFEQGNIHDKILLILDNLNEEDAALVSAGARAQWILNLEKVHIVVTTRLGPKGLGLQECISVDRLSAAEALDVLFQYRAFGRNPADPDYLAARAADERWEVYAGSDEPAAAEPHDDDEWKAALAIANRLGRHTLMVAQVGAYLGRYDIPYGTFLAEMDPAGIGLALDDVGSDAEVQQLIAHPQPTIEALLSRSLDRLAASSPLPQRILEYAAFLPPDHIPVRWLELLVRADAEMAAPLSVRKIGRDPWRDALRELADLQHLTGSESRRMHRILQEAVQRRLSPEAAALRSAQVTEMLDTVAVQLQGSHLPPQVLPEVAALRACVWPNLDGDTVAYGRVAGSLAGLLLRRGNLRDAIRCGEAAARLLALRSKQAPENADYACDLSVSYNKMGDLFRALGDGTRAREYYEQDLKIAQRLAEQAPENADYARDLSVSYDRMGDLFRALGDGTRAREYYEQALTVRQRLAEQAPENADYARDLGISFERLADMAASEGRHQEALELLARELEIGERLMHAAPENADYARYTSVVYNKLGDLFRALGDGTRAREYYEQALTVRQRLAEQAPENADYARDLSVSYNQMGDLFRALGDGTRAREYYEQALTVSQRLAEQAPENADYARDLSASLQRMGDLAVSTGNADEARDWYQKLVDLCRRLVDLAPENADYARNLSVSYNKMGDLFRALGDGTRAREYYEQALTVRQRLAEQAPENADWQRNVAVSHYKLLQFFAAEENMEAALPHLLAAWQTLEQLAARNALPEHTDAAWLEQLRQIVAQLKVES